MKIKNINGTSQSTCACGSWLKHWEKFSGQTAEYCPVAGCSNKDLAGAHVQKAEGWDDKWYILPLCSAHNQSQTELVVSGTYRLVPANKAETCERRR